MRLKIYSALAIIIIGLSYFSFAEDTQQEGLQDNNPKMALELLQNQGAVVLDVRSQGEWNAGHVSSAHLIPIQELQTKIDKVDELVQGDKSKAIIVYCQSGRRAGMAKSILLKAGYKNVMNLGGLSDWPNKKDITR